MRRLEHCNIVKLKYFFYSSGEKVNWKMRRELLTCAGGEFPWLEEDPFSRVVTVRERERGLCVVSKKGGCK